MEYFNSGFYLSYLSNLKSEIQKAARFDLEERLRTLCSFSIAQIVGSPAEFTVTEKDHALLCIYENLLSRGAPTLPSLEVERAVVKLARPWFEIVEESESGSYEFTHRQLDRNLATQWTARLLQAHIPFARSFRPDEHYTASDFDNNEEEYLFFCKYLPNVLGNHITQFFEPQRLVETILSGQAGIEFFGQKVDFAIEIENVKAVVEIDGKQHDEEPQHSLDTKRREALRNSGWTVIEIKAKVVRDGLTDEVKSNLRRLISQSPILQEIGRSDDAPPMADLDAVAQQFVLVPIGVSRVQKTILRALRIHSLSLEEDLWRIGVLERDIPCAELAVADFLTTLRHLYDLLDIDRPLPKVELFLFGDGNSPYASAPNDIAEPSLIVVPHDELEAREQRGEKLDILIDVSVCRFAHSEKETLSYANDLLRSGGSTFVVRNVSTVRGNRQVQSAQPVSYAIGEAKRESLRYFVRLLFRKTDFREGQFEILTRSLALKPVIGLLPTGAGKSLTYQLSAFMQPGVTLVIDPLRSLMFDQAANLKEIGIDNIAFINSEQTPQEREWVVRNMAAGHYQIVFIAPERLQIPSFREKLLQMTTSFPVPYLVIDEAHCVSEWGHDFRTSYLNLARVGREHCKYQNRSFPTVMALTGTASYAVLTDVQREIGIEDEEAKIYPQTFDRKELRFDVLTVPSSMKQTQLLGLLQSYLPSQFNSSVRSFLSLNGKRTNAGLVFVPHVNGEYGEGLIKPLAQQLNIPVKFYSGEAPKVFEPKLHFVERDKRWNQEKLTVQEGFKANKFPVLVSTKAFGMGIDKPNIRFTVHYGIPNSLEAFYQEAGRAGRDRKKAYCIMIFSDDNASNANKMLDSTLSADELSSIQEPSWGERGDVHRVLFFHKNAFKGTDAEKRALFEVLKEHVYPVIESMSKDETKRIVIPFGEGKSRADRERAIYRLSIVGLIQDYTVDYNAKQFGVVLHNREEGEYLECMRHYIARYKTSDFANQVPSMIRAKRGSNAIEKCLGFLVDFVYEEIEKKRRVSIAVMAETVRECSLSENKDASFRERLLAYLEKSKFTDPLLELAKRLDPAEWWTILEMVDDVDSSRQLLGGCLRTRVSYPDHPALWLLSGFARMLLPIQDKDASLSDMTTAFRLCRTQIEDAKKRERIVLDTITQCKTRFGALDKAFGELILNEIPTRIVAKNVFDVCPEAATRVLLSRLYFGVKEFNDTLSQGQPHV